MAMVHAPFNGNLNQNEIYSAIYNLIIEQQVFADPIKGTYGKLVDAFKTDGGLYGDTKLFYSVQIGDVEDWSNDSEAANLLALNRPAAPYCQAVSIDTFKKIWLTVDNFMSKRAFGSEGVFAQFNSVILGTIRDTKRVYEATNVNAFVGSEATSTGSQTVTITLPSAETGDLTADKEALNRMKAQTIAENIADVLVNVEDVTTLYNDLGYLRSYDKDDLIFVWNADYYNQITKLDLPTIFHDQGLIDKLGQYILPAKYFGDVSSATTSVANARARKDFKVGTTKYRAGDVVTTGSTVAAGSTYVPNSKIICKIIHKDAIKYMSGFETATEFFNPRSLTNSHYLIFGHSSLENSRLKEFPYITIKTA